MKITRNNLTHLFSYAFMLLASLGVSSALGQEEESAQAEQPKVMIRKIVINFTGLSNVNEEVARANMSLREGEEYDHVTVDRDIRSLMRTRLFEYVDARIKPVTEEEIDVIFDIRPKFRIAAISFEGNDSINDRRLEREVTILVNQVLNERSVKENAGTLKEFYLKRGFSQVRIDYDIDRNPGTGFGNVIFKVREGRKFKIGKIAFEGNESLKAKQLRKKMKTKKWGFLSVFTGSGKYDQDQFEDDLDVLKDEYRNEGYLDIDMDPARVKFTYPSKKRMKIEIAVDEGKQYKVGEISFEGNELYKSPLLSFLLKSRKGDRYSPEKLDEDVEMIENFYGQFGYMETRVRMTRVPNIATGDIDLVFAVYESDKHKVNTIDIEGNSKTKSTVVIRELNLGPGDTFDSVRMDAARMMLENTRYFEDVNVTPQSTNVPNHKDLRITFQEGRTGNFSFGAGFSSIEKGVFFIELTQSNFDIMNWKGAFQGDGQKFRLKAQLGSESSSTVLAFEEPWLFERRLAVGFQLFDQSVDYYSDSFDSHSRGYEIYFRKRLIERIEARVAYSFTDQDYPGYQDADEAALLSSSIGQTNSVNLLLLRDTRDRIINTFRGARYELDLKYAGGVIGGDFNYMTAEMKNAIYFPITRWHTQTIEFIYRLGTAKPLGDLSEKDVPYLEKYLTGGPNTIRGYEFRDISPTRNQRGRDFQIGGRSYGFVSAEYSIGFTEGFRGAIFYDGGFVNQGTGDFSIGAKARRIDNWVLGGDLNNNGLVGAMLNEAGTGLISDNDFYATENGILKLGGDLNNNGILGETGDYYFQEGLYDGMERTGWNDSYGVGIRISVMGTPLRLDYAIPMNTTEKFIRSGGELFEVLDWDKGSQFNFTFGGRF